jgi:vacuolar-type H+-ATPase subunit E/Vma4
MFLIKNFGNDIQCPNVSSVIDNLKQFEGKSIVVEDRRPGGKLHYLDINGGIVSESYGSRVVVDMNTLLA